MSRNLEPPTVGLADLTMTSTPHTCPECGYRKVDVNPVLAHDTETGQDASVNHCSFCSNWFIVNVEERDAAPPATTTEVFVPRRWAVA